MLRVSSLFTRKQQRQALVWIPVFFSWFLSTFVLSTAATTTAFIVLPIVTATNHHPQPPSNTLQQQQQDSFNEASVNRFPVADKGTTTSQQQQPNEEAGICQSPDDYIITPSSSPTNTMTKLRSVRKVMPRPPAHWVGDGFYVYPVFANSAFTEELSPLLMFDYAEPKKFPARRDGQKPLGVGQHPHRGFETVTVAFQGEVEHQDSTGKKGVIGQGDVQWMTAGRGIVHQEFHSEKFSKSGGTFEMCQLWVNLPKKHKMAKPGYQAILKKDIPVVNLPLPQQPQPTNNTDAQQQTNGDDSETLVLGTARIIAGELGSTKGAASTFSPVQMWDVNLPHAGSEVDLPFPPDHNCMVFVRRGAVQVVSGETKEETSGNDNNKNKNFPKLKSSDLGPQDVALMRLDGSDTLRLRVLQPDSSVMILGGEPLNEPIAAQGPFVMNTYDEINKAISDYRLGKMGK